MQAHLPCEVPARALTFVRPSPRYRALSYTIPCLLKSTHEYARTGVMRCRNVMDTTSSSFPSVNYYLRSFRLRCRQVQPEGFRVQLPVVPTKLVLQYRSDAV